MCGPLLDLAVPLVHPGAAIALDSQVARGFGVKWGWALGFQRSSAGLTSTLSTWLPNSAPHIPLSA